MTRHRIGVDLGGTKIEAIAVELAAEAPRELSRKRVATNRVLGYDHILSETRSLIEDVARHAGLDPRETPIGVGMPGSQTMRREDGTRSDVPLVKNSNTVCLNGRPFRRDLAEAVGRPIAFANDANCFALAEATWGAARGARVSFGVILGTGVGGGLVIANDAGVPRAWDGAQSIAGEWGHVALEPANGPPCYCGRRGCVEQYLSGTAIEAEYARRTGTQRKLVDFASREDARALIEERLDLFGRALATMINVVDPEVVVLGGGVSNLAALYTEGTKAVGRWVFNDELTTKIVKHALGDSAGVFGAALLP